MRILRAIILIFAFAALASNVSAKPKRNAQSVKKERRDAANEIESTRKKITANSAETRRQLNRLSSLNAETKRSNKQIASINAEIAQFDTQIAQLNDSVTLLQTQLATLRSSYAQNLRSMRTRRQQMSTLALVFSASNFTEAYGRYRHMQQLEAWQHTKSKQLAALSTQISEKSEKLSQTRNARQQKLNELKAENIKLMATQSQTQALVADLKAQGSNLKKILDEKQRQLKRLDDELNRIIAEEARRAEEERKKEELANKGKPKQQTPQKDAPKKTKKPLNSLSPEQITAMTGSFEANKGKMPFPVAGRYTIVSHFGLNAHPDVTNVKVNNSGIDIEAQPGASARAAFNGEVSSVFRVSGYNNVVMLRHGSYLTVYAGIENLAVKKGDKVQAGQTLGTIFTDPDDSNRTLLHFEVRRERAKLNPEDWVK